MSTKPEPFGNVLICFTITELTLLEVLPFVAFWQELVFLLLWIKDFTTVSF